MAIRKRRRRKYTWLPTDQITAGAEGVDWQANGFRGSMEVQDSGIPAYLIHPMCPADEPIEPNDIVTGTSLSDVIGSEYFVKRIVGGFFGCLSSVGTAVPTQDQAAQITLGIFVARAQDSEANANLPLGIIGNILTDGASFNPQNVNTIREPWMFRRTWVLSSGIVHASDAVGEYTKTRGAFPTSTAHYSGLHSGPHVDVKSVRRVRQDERLFAVVAATSWPLNFGQVSPSETPWAFEYSFDYRILGALRRAKNRSNF